MVKRKTIFRFLRMRNSRTYWYVWKYFQFIDTKNSFLCHWSSFKKDYKNFGRQASQKLSRNKRHSLTEDWLQRKWGLLYKTKDQLPQICFNKSIWLNLSKMCLWILEFIFMSWRSFACLSCRPCLYQSKPHYKNCGTH